MSKRIGAATEEFLVHQPGSFTAQIQGGKEVRNQAEDFGHAEVKHLRISMSKILRLVDVGLSKLCPKTSSQFRSAHGLQIKTEILLTKIVHGKVVEEIELIYVHCFTTQELQIKLSKTRTICPNRVKTISFQDHIFATN